MNMKNMGNLNEKGGAELKNEFVFCLIDSICEGNDESISKLILMLSEVSLTSMATHLMALFLQSMAFQDYRAANQLKKEIVHFIEINDYQLSLN